VGNGNRSSLVEMNSSKWIIGALVVLVGIAGLSHIREDVAESSKRTLSDVELAAEKAVSVLPPGTEDAWLAYVDHRIAATLHRTGNVIQITDGLNEMLGITQYVSANSPYEISCDGHGGTLTFGHVSSVSCGESGVPESDSEYSVDIYGSVTNADPSAEKAPPLGVSEQSVAAVHLNKVLCQRIAEQAQKLVAAESMQCGAQK
jgi:hypothetical protein